MQGKDYILSRLQDILKEIPAEQAELVYNFRDSQLTRFAGNYIHQNVAQRDGSLTIKLVNGKKIAVASTNSLEPEIINNTISRLKASLALVPEDPNFVSLPFPEPYPQIETFDRETAECTPEQRALMVKVITSEAEKFGVITSGQCSTCVSELAIANSLGIRAYNCSTEANLLAMATDVLEGFSSLLSGKISAINARLVAEESVSKCVKAKNPVEIEPDFYPVILQSYGVSQLLEHLCYQNFNAKDYMEERSCISGKLGEKITGDLITIHNDGLNPEGLPRPFDMEGVPKSAITLIEKGIAKSVAHNSYTANQLLLKSNGNQVAPTYKTPYPMNLVMENRTDPIGKMVESIERGIYVTRLNYINVVDAKQTVNTGLTRGGTFLIENGKITSPVYNLRFTDSILKLLGEVSMISKERRLGGDFNAPILSPTVKIDRFRFTGSSRPTD
jgi:PmbA protein